MITSNNTLILSQDKNNTAPISQCHLCVLDSTLYTDVQRLQAIYSNKNGEKIEKNRV